jgi:ABC-type iron transport system FetAB ATPase subunit
MAEEGVVEPTSALDPETTQKVEKTLLGLLPNGDQVRSRFDCSTQSLISCSKPDGTLKALVWITHSAEQGDRVGTRTFDVSQH